MNQCRTCLSLLLSLVLLHIVAIPAPAADSAAPVITRQQIEADWLRQDKVRDPAGAASVASATGVVARSYPTALAIERGLNLIDDLRKLGAHVDT